MDDDTLENRREMPYQFAEEVFAKGNLEFIDQQYDENWVGHVDGEDVTLEEHKEEMQALLEAFPDVELTFETVIADEDYTASCWEMTGTHEGEFYGVKPTGREIRVTGNTMARWEDGKQVEMWETIDRLSMMQQLGLAPEDFTLRDLFRTFVNVVKSGRSDTSEE